ncbi:hypothetical protein UACE39S_05321 [Ureibacillus acetophenoni]
MILSIILISIFTILIQSAKTTKSAENIVDANYLAQSEMERIYALSLTLPSILDEGDPITEDKILSSLICQSSIQAECYQGLNNTKTPFIEPVLENPKQLIEYYGKVDSSTNLYIKLTIQDITNNILPEQNNSKPFLTRIIIRVFDKLGGTLQSQLEQTIQWGE